MLPKRNFLQNLRIHTEVFMHNCISQRECADWCTRGPSQAGSRVPRNETAPSMLALDFDVLFRAVRERLRLSAQGDEILLPTVVLECTEALEQLHQILIQDRELPKLNRFTITRADVVESRNE